MPKKDVLISVDVPEEPIISLKYCYIVIDSKGELHYEFNNKGHIVLPIHFSEMNPWKLHKNLPGNLIKECVSDKNNIVGVLQVWFYYTHDYCYARIKAVGILKEYVGNLGSFRKLLAAMDAICKQQGVIFIETETSVIPESVMKRVGFEPVPSKSFLHRFSQKILRQKSYVKRYVSSPVFG